MPGHLEIAKVGKDTHEIRLSGQGGERLDYELWFRARNAENINFDEAEWPPKKKDDYYYIGRPDVGFGVWGSLEEPADSCRAHGLTEVKLERKLKDKDSAKVFNVYYVDETTGRAKRKTVAKGVTEYTWYVSPWANPVVKAGLGVIGVAIATGFIGSQLNWW